MIAWITGGGTGIGLALAEALVRDGANVVISGRRQAVLDQALQRLRAISRGDQAIAISGDASDPLHAKAVVADAQKRWGPITLLINNAGANTTTPVFETPIDDYQNAFQINCLSAITCTQAVLPAMQSSGIGSILTISSVYGKWGSCTSGSYSVSKFAVTGYMDALRQGLSGSGIHAMTVYPGFIRTDMTMPFVVPGSLRSRMGKSPDQCACAILRALRQKKTELYYPGYVSWVLRLHRWFPKAADRLARRVKR